jgi:hypothetical protein
VLRREELLRQDRGPAADRVEHALADADATRVLADDAHERLQREFRSELRVHVRAVAVLGRPQSVRMLELQLVPGPHVVEARGLEALRGLDDLGDRRVARRERSEREGAGIQAWHDPSSRDPDGGRNPCCGRADGR